MIPRPIHVRTPDGVNICYQMFGTGPRRLVYVPRTAHAIGYMWQIPAYARFLARLGEEVEVMAIDVRGGGFADRIVPGDRALSLEARIVDILAAMDHAGWAAASFLGVEDGGSLSALLAALHPERVERLVLYGAYARGTRTDDYQVGATLEEVNEFIDSVRAQDFSWDYWLTQMAGLAPSHLDDEDFARRLALLYFGSASSVEVWEVQRDVDIRTALRSVAAPTLVIDRADNLLQDVAVGDALASFIPDARRVTVPGVDFEMFAGDPEPILREVLAFLAGHQPRPPSTRVLTTVVFTDIVDSTRWVRELGDSLWRRRVAQHHEVVRGIVAEFDGREVDTAGDGFFMTFDGPARAAQAALEIVAAVPRETGLSVRAGVHTGEVELDGADVRGVAVHIGSRICAQAGAGEVLASGIVKDLTAGSDLAFTDDGEHALKGFDAPVRLFRVT